MLALALLSVASIIGRALSGFGLGPIPGDFELVEAGTALAVFCSLPWCYLVRGHAVVDLFWNGFSPALQRTLESGSALLMLLVWVLLTWRLGVGMLDYRASGEVGFILQMPTWWGYAAALPPAVIGCVAYAWRLFETFELINPPSLEALQGTGH
jgi:TRAP-type C4-dicarboxylate transport system permease small subunit